MRHSTVFVIIALLSITLPAHSQRQWNKPLRSSNYVAAGVGSLQFGIKLGGLWNYFDYPSLNGNQWNHIVGNPAKYTHYDGKFGPIAGVAIEYKPNDLFSVGLEGHYAKRGTKMHHNKEYLVSYTMTDTTNTIFDCNLDALEVRIPFTFYIKTILFSDPQSRGLYASISPEVSYLLGGTMEMTKTRVSNDSIMEHVLDTVGSSNMQRINYGVNCGVGYWSKHDMQGYSVIMKYELSFDIGVNNTFSNSEQAASPNNKRFHRAVEASVSIMMPMKKRLRGACIRWGDY